MSFFHDNHFSIFSFLVSKPYILHTFKFELSATRNDYGKSSFGTRGRFRIISRKELYKLNAAVINAKLEALRNINNSWSNKFLLPQFWTFSTLIEFKSRLFNPLIRHNYENLWIKSTLIILIKLVWHKLIFIIKLTRNSPPLINSI